LADAVAASRDASATTAAAEESLQSNMSWVVPAVTPTIKVVEGTATPVPAVTVTLHGALEVTCGVKGDANALPVELMASAVIKSNAPAPVAKVEASDARRAWRLCYY